MEEIKVGIIGCGNIAIEKHIPSLSKLSNVEIVAFQDVDIKRAKEVRDNSKFKKAKVYTDYNDLLDDEMDVVHVCTPNKFHAEISIQAMKKGKHVMCEKPLATSIEDIEKLIEVSNITGKKLSVSMQNRFRKECLTLKKICENDELGEIYYGIAHATRRRAIPTWGKFLDKEIQGGGPLIDIGVHAIDLTLWLMNNFKPKYVVGKTYQKLGKEKNLFNSLGKWDTDKFNVEDSAFGFLVMENGATVIIESSWALNTLMAKEAKSTLCGTKGGADMNDGLRINGDKSGYLFETIPHIAKDKLEYYDDFCDNEKYVECKMWIDCILKDKDPIVSAKEALIVMKIINGIYKSCETGEPVYF